jgi:hypothetical protein
VKFWEFEDIKMTSVPAIASPAASAPVPLNGAAAAPDLHQALVALARLLARQAVREWLDEAAPPAAEPREHGERP